MKSSLIEEFPSVSNTKTGWPWTEETVPAAYDQNTLWPRISIVTPNYNGGKYLEETIRSVLLQHYPNLEYIIIDGGSTDNSIEIIKKYEKFLTYWVSEKDQGQSDAINKGLKKCTGEVFNWLNSDDYYVKGALKTVGKHFAENDINVLCGNVELFDENGGKLRLSNTRVRSTFQETLLDPKIEQPGTFFRRQILDELGPLNVELHYCMDLEWWLKYLICYGQQGIKEIGEVLVRFRKHAESKTLGAFERIVNDKRKIYCAILDKLIGLPDYDEPYEFEADITNVEPVYLIAMANHELMRGAVYYYGKRDFQKASDFLRHVQNESLNESDLKEYKRMAFRMKLPAFIFGK